MFFTLFLKAAGNISLSLLLLSIISLNILVSSPSRSNVSAFDVCGVKYVHIPHLVVANGNGYFVCCSMNFFASS